MAVLLVNQLALRKVIKLLKSRAGELGPVYRAKLRSLIMNLEAMQQAGDATQESPRGMSYDGAGPGQTVH